ncbi:DUF1588 domain-containing protein [Humisphaera borealis]|uniref:DUF1588 domain-containing protein n=1 Tax=Humisphaera borealis TaxID=2807512 RepID=A0A7M2WZW8_9BACT|nr:DUF1588 domain-containing protein [Humisphaera borealis]QOV91057.1 DUF1588 domain-containing protein [Humisphaera borealis]
MARQMCLTLLVTLVLSGSVRGADQAATPAEGAVPQPVQEVLRTYCVDCHGQSKSKGQVRLDTLSALDSKVRLDLMNKVQEQIHFAEMPPDDQKQPSPAERKLLADWVRGELIRSNAPLIEDKLRYPDYGNAVDHDRLFGGSIQEKPYTPVRRWLVSPMIFKERVIDVFGLTGRERDTYSLNGASFYGVTNPFILPDRSGIRDYAITPLDGGHLLVMLNNAQWISHKQIRAARVKKGDFKADFFENRADRFAPSTPAAFETIILNPAKPTDDALVTAIQTQFSRTLQRPATDTEVAKYLALTRSAIDLAGNTEGLRQMLVAVLLESEFLYRMEFGAGPTDAAGRRMLSPREAGFAISYALGDRGPDAVLVKAAAEGRLGTKDDYKREVLRLLADKTYYKGRIDYGINDSDFVSHPKIVRFFREFFGYPNAVKVFKDKNRSGGYYDNPGRGSSATPGRLISEADRIVALHVEQDRNVFENLLTTDRYFMYHNVDNEKGLKIVADWKELYDTLKDTDWRKNPDKVAAQYADLLKKNRVDFAPTGRGAHSNTLTRVMQHLSYTLGKGNTPFTTFPWAHGNQFRYSQSYSLPATPGVNGQYGEDDDLNYPVVQPFQIANRKGILTHPAWLIAHSSNFHTDPIRRGRWIQEKLLAGRVPDVPITVDAKVPEDPHKTFRQRVESVTGEAQTACWKCHQHMNPLGYPFEYYDDFGRYRKAEPLENPENLVAKSKDKYGADTYKTKAVETSGYLRGTGDPKLDGPVTDALEMIDRLSKSARVRQSIIRHAFRFYLGRNEMLSDSQTLIDADKAYVESGGSFNAVIVSLLTSDSFMYRK